MTALASLETPTLDPRASAALDGPVALGLSGGGDSVALLHLLRDRAVVAVVIDHALRPGSEEDAARAAALAQSFAVPTRIVTLRWSAGEKRSQAALRRRRHAALYEAARAIGARVVALAHTADDQAETVLMRAARSGWLRAAGMAPVSPAPIWPEGRGITIARPLLNVRRAALRAWLAHEGAAWIEDPSNENAAYERVRVRRRLARDGEDVLRLARVGAGLRARADRANAAAWRWLASAQFEADAVVMPRASLAAPAAARALRAVIAAIAGAPAPPTLERAQALAARASGARFRGATLGGARLAPRGETLRIERDRGAVLGRAGAPALAPLPLFAGKETVWDGRLALIVDRPGWRAEAGGGGAPILVSSAGAATVPEAMAAGWARARWLVRDRTAQLLGADAG